MQVKRSKVSLLEVARVAGVSPATVSRVINRSAPVSDSVRDKVMEIAEDLGYELPPSRPLSGGTTRTVGVLITDILNPFFPELIRGIDVIAKAENISLLLYDTGEDSQTEQQILRRMSEHELDGVIVCGSRIPTDELAAFSRRYQVPLVMVNRSISSYDVPCIRVDFEKALYHAARHLISLGHTRIGYMEGPTQNEVSITRRSGLVNALEEAGLALRPEYIINSFPTVAGGFQAMSALLSLPEGKRPTAVQAYNDLMALGALQAIRAHRLSVPRDISVIGFDDIALAEHANPPLTTVEQPKMEMGSLAMKTLRELMDHFSIHMSGGYTLLESRLIVRESTGPVKN